MELKNHITDEKTGIGYKFVGYLELPSIGSRHNYREETRQGVAVEYLTEPKTA